MVMDLDLQRHPHRRRNLLTGEWVLVSPHRTERPWQGQVESAAPATVPAYDPKCYMCPGNERANGQRNPPYTSTFVFTNDFPALKPDTPRTAVRDDELLAAAGETGVCRVVCFSPRHDLTLARMPLRAIRDVVDCWAAESEALGANADVAYVQVFENRGAMMGASNPHPHGQIWATSFVPREIAREIAAQEQHQQAHGRGLLGAYIGLEEQREERLVYSNDAFVCVVPFWATWPFETLIVARSEVGTIGELDDAARRGLADVLQRTTSIYDRLFDSPFPYSMGFHQRPAGATGPFRLHAHFYPPLLRSAVVRKHMVGFELLAMPQRDITPEWAAGELRRAGLRLAGSSATPTPSR
jgi:UDPglucose--hexose-1-phosphate uridylyltransferase